MIAQNKELQAKIETLSNDLEIMKQQRDQMAELIRVDDVKVCIGRCCTFMHQAGQPLQKAESRAHVAEVRASELEWALKQKQNSMDVCRHGMSSSLHRR